MKTPTSLAALVAAAALCCAPALAQKPARHQHPGSKASQKKPAQMASAHADAATRRRIDSWIRAHHRNPYGDPSGTMYAGGTPLFDERTGKSMDRYEYILKKHPELRPANPHAKHK
jgi:hypothetical protein